MMMVTAMRGAAELLTRNLENAASMWAALKAKYSVVTPGARQRATKEWMEAKFALGQDGTAWADKLVALASRLEDVGTTITEEEMKTKMVVGLPEIPPWDAAKFGLYSNLRFTTLEVLRDTVVEMALKHKSSSSTKAAAPYGAQAITRQSTNSNNNNNSNTNNNKRKPAPPAGYTCYSCNEAGHWRHDCHKFPNPNKTTNKRRRHHNSRNANTNRPNFMASPKASNNNNNATPHSNHVRPGYQGRNYDPNYQRSPSTPNAAAIARPDNSTPIVYNQPYHNDITNARTTTIISASASAASCPVPSRFVSWLIDSAEGHMTANRSLFSFLKESDGGSVRAAGGELYPIVGTGDVIVSVNPTHSITLNDVLFVPGLHDNLISQVLLEDDGALFSSARGKMQIPYQNVTLCVDRIGKAYRIIDYASPYDSSAISSAISVSSIHVPSVFPSICIPEMPAEGELGEELIASLLCTNASNGLENDKFEAEFSMKILCVSVAEYSDLTNSLTRKDKVPEAVGRRPAGYVKPPLVALKRQDQGGESADVRMFRFCHRRLGHLSPAKMQQLAKAAIGIKTSPSTGKHD